MNPIPFKHLSRYADLAKLLYKYGRGDVVESSGLRDAVRKTDPDGTASHDWDNAASQTTSHSSAPPPEEFAADLESLGPTFIKLGQLLSTRPDFVSEPYRLALAKLQDKNSPIDLKQVFRTIEQELGDQPEHLYQHFDVNPLATASLGQVHRATMEDGREVVVKVLRPDIEVQLNDDIEAMETLANTCEKLGIAKGFQLKHLVESLRHSLAQEVDYENEARNSVGLARNLSEFEDIVVPEPIESHCSRRVLTLEYVPGEKITELETNRLSSDRRRELVDQLFTSFIHQVLVHGAFHADPHPGNVLLGSDDRIVLLDHGLVVNVPPRLQKILIKLLLAICEGDGSRAAELAEDAGVHGDDFSSTEFRIEIERIVADNVNQSVEQMNSGAALMRIHQTAGQHDLKLPIEVILLGRAMMQLDEVVSCLDPGFNPNEKIREQAAEVMRRHSGQEISLSSLYQTLLETTEFAQQLPARANKFADLIANNKLQVKVQAVDENRLISGLNKVANRISAGLIIAAMIIGAALMMRLETHWTVLGYPAIAFCFMAFAAIAGGILVWRVVISDNFN